MEKDNRKQINSLSKAFKILDIIEQLGHPVSLTEISARTGWPKSTVYGLLSTMVDHQILNQSSSDDKYCLGIKLFELGSAVGRSWDIVNTAHVHLQHLALASQEAAYLSILAEPNSVLLDTVQLPGSFKVVSSIGSRAPIYCTAQGQVLLAYQPQNTLIRIAESTHYMKYTPHTTDSAERLLAVCAQIRENGYRIEKGEYRMGLCSVAAPIFDSTGEAKFAVGIVGMFQDIHSAKFAEIVDEVKNAASLITREWKNS
jgi:DNA-binding IclR family transcriptional regulator